MNERRWLYLKLHATAIAAVGVGVGAIYWPGGVLSVVAFLVSWAIGCYVVYTCWGFGRLGRHLRELDQEQVRKSHEHFFRDFPWLRRKPVSESSKVDQDS